MNVERLTKLAKWLDSAKRRRGVDGLVAFDMSTFRTKSKCGTTACIAGAAVEFFSGRKRMPRYDQIRGSAADLLGLDGVQADRLFTPFLILADEELSTYEAINDEPSWAARTIRHLIATGNVDWLATRNAP